MSFYPAREIIPNVWVGSAGDSRDIRFLRRHNIGLVINATKTIPFSSKYVLGYRVPVDDHPSENDRMAEYFPITSRIIDETLKTGKGVLIHCYAGIQRSCAVAAAYLMYKNEELSPKRAMTYIKSRKPEAFDSIPTFQRALYSFYYTFQ